MNSATSFSGSLEARTIIDPDVLDNPYPFFERLRQEHPVWLVPGLDLAFVASHEHVLDALRRIDDFSSHLDVLVITGEDGSPALFRTDNFGEGTTTLATADPPEHTKHRSVVFPELVARRMEEMRPYIESIVADHISNARAEGTQVEWANTVAHPIPARVVGHLIGLPDEDWPDVMRWALGGGLVLAGIYDLETMAALLAGIGDATPYLIEKLDEAGNDPGSYLVGVCAKAVASGDLKMREATATLGVLLGAGGESTASLIGNATRMLAENPKLQDQIRADHNLIEPYIEEVLRLESPFRGHYRQVKRECELGGVTLKAGTTAMLLWASANRDAAEYDRPDEVVLNRRIPRSHLAFGRGIHHCVGASLARMEGASATKLLLQETSFFSLVDDDPPQWESSMFVRRNEHLPLDISWN
ncbi:MAG: cytochrome P450 [Acidimicrobiaceae bacterium]|nr:cytochrome P450 [Acidimicrobiaceae bacterium]MYA75691.1 cytochrome P450 [Acidimicrobiaceae bacterium]MYC42958.1 cytochrome P450 [Acidimicrobiaceae bacterium]MYG55709.1 cytochrome P450 [Acidimicrobiaceae bacterium]MYH87120.1 cytochrome P450 [Acidimicrobiaceae bacterium]